MNRIRNFLCNVMGWHQPFEGRKAFDGSSYVSVCRHCNRKILQDSQGNWFTVENRGLRKCKSYGEPKLEIKRHE